MYKNIIIYYKKKSDLKSIIIIKLYNLKTIYIIFKIYKTNLNYIL